MKTVIALLYLCHLCNAQQFGWGGCPTPSVKENFDLDRYLGKWYEVMRYPFVIFQRNLRCGTAEYSYTDDGSIKIVNSGTSTARRTEGEREVAIGKAVVVDEDEPAKLRVSFGESFFQGDSANYWVVDTDYSTYSIVYSCTNLYFFRLDILWILGREKEFSEDMKESLFEKISDEGIRTSMIVEMDQSCTEGAYKILEDALERN